MLRRWMSFGLLLALAASSWLVASEPSPRTTKRVLLLGQGPDGHPRGTHEYLAGMKLLADCLKPIRQVDAVVIRADDPWNEGPELLSHADGVVLFVSEGAKWIQGDPRRLQAFAKLAERRGGFAVLHWGMGTKDAEHIAAFLKLFGGCHGGPDRKYKVIPKADVRIADRRHPVVSGIEPFRLREEFYYRLKFAQPLSDINPLLQTEIDGNLETVCWAWQRPDGGRSFGFSGGHFHANWDRPEYRRLMAQAVLWTLQVPVPAEGLDVNLPASAAQQESK